MPVVTICNHKGGTGKTTTVIHLAAAAGLSGRRTLVVDLDPQGFLTRMLGAEEPPPEHSALALLDT
jgi:chromosome partitioning protein